MRNPDCSTKTCPEGTFPYGEPALKFCSDASCSVQSDCCVLAGACSEICSAIVGGDDVPALHIEPTDGCAVAARALLPQGLVSIIAAEMHIEFVRPGVSKGRTLQRFCQDTLEIAMDEVPTVAHMIVLISSCFLTV